MYDIEIGRSVSPFMVPKPICTSSVSALTNLVFLAQRNTCSKYSSCLLSKGYEIDEKEAEQTAKVVGLAAIKYGDLSNQASKDYIF